MRIVMGSLIVLTMAAHPASGNEVFIAQVTGKTAAIEQTAIATVKTAISAARLALPLQPNAANPPAQVAAATANTSSVMQSGTNNFAAVSQTGGGNASSVIQHGSGNQAIVMQRH